MQQQQAPRQQQPERQPQPAAAPPLPPAPWGEQQQPAAAAAAAPDAKQQQRQPPAGHAKCQFYLESKRRFCKFAPVPGKRFCGNHRYEGEGTGPKRVPCPWDPKGGHTVLESELEKHKTRCPGYQFRLAERQQPYFCEDINAGSGPEAEFPPHLHPAAAAAVATAAAAAAQPAADGAAPAQAVEPAGAAAGGGGGGGGSRRRQRRRERAAQAPTTLQAAYAAAMGEQRFMELLQRVEAACTQICEPEAVSEIIPPEAEPFLLPDSATANRRFSLKHAQQQASIVGNMKQRGLLSGVAGVTYVEYGAGKGYLSHMLASCSEARKVVMMDYNGFKDKADRSMRHLEMQRLRCDIKDFDVAQVPGLEGGAPWVAFGKHLCGAATDFTLRSCAQEHHKQQQQQQQQQGSQRPGAAGTAAAAGGQCEQGLVAAHSPAAAAAASDPTITIGGGGSSGDGGGGSGVRGLAVATCCHHRCTWRHFVAQDVMVKLGFSPQEFEVIAWMTGWALCGHEAPAGFGGSDGEEQEEQQQEGQQQEEGGKPHAAAAAAAARQAGAAASIVAASGAGGSGSLPPRGPASHKRGREEVWQPSAPPAAAGAAAAADPMGDVAASSAASLAVAAAVVPPASPPAAAGGVAVPPLSASQAPPASHAEGEWRPQWALPREQRIAAGQRCKRLIDAARLRWLRQQGFSAALVHYVPSSVSGENRLLLATVQNQQG